MITQTFKNESLSTRVADYIRKEILLGGKFKKGQHLREVELSEKLDISRSTLREALRELEKQGLVHSVPRKGAYVSDFDHQDFEEIYQVRQFLETGIYRDLIEERLLDEEDFTKLNKMVDNMVALTRYEKNPQQKLMEFNEMDVEFHQFLWERSNKKWFRALLQNIFFPLRMTMLQDLILENNMEESARTHYDLVEALRERNLEGAVKAFKNHILFRDQER
ncbi:MAG TPA: GntR family transcriptional regulator [Synergistales bacterium]|nr:GntR family transcriptional regulator [Synergistales bacterium]